ncbi:GYD domain-containing protein [Bosea sp. F3-2]|uniref:GYD domain-containing protein n=1 Tax=Bosea sp. F3-2 TaxID=2599640 RepID=UPI0011EBAF11|nr:GYD domain-containing protein [Bosea sp. F3-2]QEL21272.1 GYD domain-containing protein [Bosea sp. F3-2]
MTTYIMLANWTDQGARNVNASPNRLDAAKQALKDMGGEFKAFFMTMGKYDMVIVCEAPDDAVQARFALQLAMLGNVRTQTLKAFPEAAYREIIRSVS